MNSNREVDKKFKRHNFLTSWNISKYFGIEFPTSIYMYARKCQKVIFPYLDSFCQTQLQIRVWQTD
jgi:hypothetical protein